MTQLYFVGYSLLIIAFGFFIGIRWERFRPEAPKDPGEAMRKLMNACSDDLRIRTDGCEEITTLRNAGYEVKMTGGTRAGFVRLDLLNPKSKSK